MATWPSASLKVEKGQTMVNMKFYYDVYVIKLQEDIDNFWGITVFTMFCPFATHFTLW